MQEALRVGEPASANSSEAEFRSELRTWLAANLPEVWHSAKAEPARLADRFAFRHGWHRRLYAGGWLGLRWPKPHGGRELTLSHQIIFNEECARFEVPAVANWVGLELVGPTLIAWGTAFQKEHYLPRILNGEHVWCQGWSEADAGSDLAAIATTAKAPNGCFVIDGRKRWASWAAFASHCMVLARTGPVDKRHAALTAFIVPLTSPGVLVRPIRMANEEAEENEVLLQSVRVPAENIVGTINGGWPVALTGMEHARAATVSMRMVEVLSSVNRLLRVARKQAAGSSDGRLEARVRERLMRVVVRAEALQQHAHRQAGPGSRADLAAAAATDKILWSSVVNDIANVGLHIEGPLGLMSIRRHEELWPGEWTQRYFRAKGTAIEGGTTEIHRELIARRLLWTSA